MIKHKDIDHAIILCKLCPFEAVEREPEMMNEHVKQNHKPKNISHKEPDNLEHQCNQCKYIGTSKANLKKHKITKHKAT